jgi:hypothetical protein
VDCPHGAADDFDRSRLSVPEREPAAASHRRRSDAQ